MSLQSLQSKYGITPLKKVSSSKLDLGTEEGLKQKAIESGLGKEAQKITEIKPKLSFLQRLGKGLDVLNPAEAILTGIEKGNVFAGVGEYVSGAGKGIASAVTGTDYIGEKRHFSDVVAKLGIENSIAKAGIGFIGDVLLDPSTYFGGAIAKGIVKGAGVATKTTLKGVGKVAPDVERGLTIAGTGLQDALGKAFKYGYKTTAGAKEDILTFLSKSQRAKLGLAASNLNRLGTGTLTKEQSEELALKMVAGKRAEFAQRELSQDVLESASWFQPFKNKITRLLDTREKDLGKLGTEINNLEKKGLKASLKGVKEEVLPKKVSSTKIKTVPEKEQIVAFDKYDIPTREISPASPLKRTATDASFVSLGTRETAQFVNSLIKKSKPELDAIKKMIGTREKWKTDLIDEITGLRNEYAGLAKTQGDTVKLADTLFAQRGAVAREVAKSSDPLVQKTIEAQSARAKKFSEGIVENPYETYFPFIKKDKLTKFLNETNGLKVGSEGYKKQFKNILTNENIELDPAKAFFTREAQVVTDKMTRNFLTGFVSKYGKQLDAFKNSDDAAKEGFQLIKEKGIFGKELGYVPEFDAKLIRDSLSPEFQTISMLGKATGFDAVTSLFKRSVTGLFAPFHVRNYVSGNIQNFEVLGAQVFNPKNIAIGQKIAYNMGKGKKFGNDIIELGGKKMKFSQVMKPFEDRFSGDTFYNADFDLALKSGTELKSVAGTFTKARLKETAKTVGLGQEAIPFKIGRAIGQYIEHQQKATAYVTALGQGKSVAEALALTEKAGFDYRALTAFESQIMRRIIPFYSFTRKNLELQLKTLGENPQRINQVLKFFEGISDTDTLTEEERQALPDYLRDQITVGFGKNKLGQPIVAGGFGTPIEQPGQLFGKGLGDTIRKIASTLNPLIKAPMEKAFGKDFFQDRPIKEIIDAKQYQILPDYIKDFISFKEVPKDILEKDKYGKLKKTGTKMTYTADPEKLHILRNLPTSRLFGYLYEIYRPEEETVAGAKILNLVTGVKPKPIDLETVKYFRDKKKREELEQLLMRAGVLKEFKNVYVPKK